MRSKIAQRILDQTSEETKRKVREFVNRQLAQELDLNVVVVDKAIENLVRMGLVGRSKNFSPPPNPTPT